MGALCLCSLLFIHCVCLWNYQNSKSHPKIDLLVEHIAQKGAGIRQNGESLDLNFQKISTKVAPRLDVAIQMEKSQSLEFFFFLTGEIWSETSKSKHPKLLISASVCSCSNSCASAVSSSCLTYVLDNQKKNSEGNQLRDRERHSCLLWVWCGDLGLCCAPEWTWVGRDAPWESPASREVAVPARRQASTSAGLSGEGYSSCSTQQRSLGPPCCRAASPTGTASRQALVSPAWETNRNRGCLENCPAENNLPDCS